MDASPSTAAITPREREVWSLVGRHLTNAEIAGRLYLSVRTVETHVSSLIRKLQVTDRRALARLVETDQAIGVRDHDRWPAPVTAFLGRARECGDLQSLLGGHRMVTVCGPGGVGKTRLALRVAQEVAALRRDGGWFVDLVQVTDPEMVGAAVAAAVGVPERQGGSLDDAVVNALAASDALLLLDNCEHLLGGVRPFVERLLAACPSLTVLATSRARLLSSFEQVYAVPGLSVTDDGGDAVALFVQRAASAGAAGSLDLPRVATLCRAMDGVALAIELAAARYPSLGLDGLLAGFDHSLRLLTSGAESTDRHRSLRDALSWSYDLLGEDDRTLLCTVSAFASWFDLAAAGAVAGPGFDLAGVADGLARLAESSLLVAVPGAPTRYRALEMVRQYADARLAELGRRDAVHARHREWCRARLRALAGRPPDDAWCERLDDLAPDARAAVMRAPEGADPDTAGLAEQLAGLLLLRGLPAEAQRRYEQAADRTQPGADRARLLRLAAGAAASRMVGNDTLRLLDAAATEALAVAEPGAAAEDLAWMSIYTRQAPGIIAVVPSEQQDRATLGRARSLSPGSPRAMAAVATATASGLDDVGAAGHAVSLARDAGAPLVESAALDQLCACHLARWQYAGALEALGRREAVIGSLPLDAMSAFQFNDLLLMASEVRLAVGDLALAGRYADRLAALPCYRGQDHLGVARRIKVDALAGDLDGAAARGEAFLASWQRAGRPRASNLNVTAYSLAMVHGLLGDDDRRQQWVDVTLELGGVRPAGWLESWSTGWAPTLDAVVLLDRGRHDLALQRLSADIDDHSVWGQWHTALWRPWYAALWAEAALLGGHPDAAERVRRSVPATADNPVATAIVRRAADLTSGDLDRLPAHARTFDALGCRYQHRRTLALRAAATSTPPQDREDGEDREPDVQR